jgi:putative ABC transport system permease protein
MLKSYFKVALRNFKKQPVYTFINLFGLAVGITCCLFISMYIIDELSYDRHHQYAENIYRINQTIEFDSQEDHSATTPFPLAEALRLEFQPSIKETVRFFDLEAPAVSIGNVDTNEFIRQEKFFFADPSIFRVFDIPLTRGNRETALAEPNSAIITRRVAGIYFGDEDPIGKDLIFEGRLYLTVTGIMDEWPDNSHFKADILASFESLRNVWQNYEQITERWRWNPVWTYVLLDEGTDPVAISDQMPVIVDRFYTSSFSENENVTLNLQLLKDIRLYSDVDNEIEPTSSYVYVYLFSIIGFLILLVACINFVNLSTARAMQRSKEVGLRKTLGAYTSQLRWQFMTESFLYTIAAVLLGVFFTLLIFPAFNQFTGKSIMTGQFGYPGMGFTLLAITFVVALMAGLYPASFLSSYSPVESLRGTFTKGKKGGNLRRLLVLMQFIITALLIIGTTLAYFQYRHLQDKKLGFDRESVVVIPSSMSLTIWYYDDFKERLLNYSAIQNVSGSKTIIGSEDSFKYEIIPEGFGSEQSQSLTKLFVDYDYLETMGIELLAGRSFSKEFSTDPENAVLINNRMVEYLDWGSPEEAIGRTFRMGEQEVSVIGVTGDFHHTYLRRELEPLILDLPADSRQFVANIEYIKVRINSGNPEDALGYMEEVWNEIDQAHPFTFYFLDEKLQELYESEEQLTSLLTIFALLAIFIGCLGLLGLASYSVSSRTREIGIRKALGATSAGIFLLLSKEYLKLVLIAHLIALPIIYFVADRWLQNFPYQMDLITILIFTFAGSLVISVVISLLTITSQSYRAAIMNPVDSLTRE